MNETQSRAAWRRRPGADAWQAENGKTCDEAFALRLRAATMDLREAREATQQTEQQETASHE